MIWLPSGVILPITGPVDYQPCVKCLKADGKWQVTVADGVDAWCARCFLYDTEWGRSVRDQIDDLVIKVEDKISKGLRDVDGMVIADECDRILMSIVLVSGYAINKFNESSGT